MAVLQISELSAGYGPLRVIHDLDLTVEKGERIGIAGLNGHGKTTLFMAIVGLTDWQTGSIEFNGRQIGGRRMSGPGKNTYRIAREGLSLVPQGDALFPGLTVKENIQSGATTRASWSNRRQRLDELVDVFEPLARLMKSPAGKLSGGERRMVSLARGFMSDASVYLIDEPSLGLAPKVAEAVMRSLDAIDVDRGSLVIAEQNVTLLASRVDRLLGMHSGRLKQDVGAAFAGVGSPDDTPPDTPFDQEVML